MLSVNTAALRDQGDESSRNDDPQPRAGTSRSTRKFESKTCPLECSGTCDERRIQEEVPMPCCSQAYILRESSKGCRVPITECGR